MRKGFTLIELIIVVVIAGVLVSFAMPGFIGAQRKTIDREACTNLKLIQTAEKTHELEEGEYVACSGNNDCNGELNLDLPAGGNWTYAVSSSGADFTATATGTKGTQDWTIGKDDDEAF